MNHRETPSLPTGVHRGLRCLSLLLIPVVAPEAAPDLSRHRGAAGNDSVPYLTFVGAPALRFEKANPPPDLSVRPAAGAPPIPALTPTEASVAQANAAAARSTTSTASPAESVATAAKADSKTPPAATKPSPAPILPDDTRPAVRPEDFLPYFQIPGANKQPSEVNLTMPASALTAPAAAPLPPSSATYTQTPK